MAYLCGFLLFLYQILLFIVKSLYVKNNIYKKFSPQFLGSGKKKGELWIFMRLRAEL